MSVSEISNRWLNRLYKSVAIFLVTFAVLISALRLLLPYAHHYRTDLQNHINENYQTDIKIGSLTMGWQKSGPVLIAENVVLINTPSLKASLGRLFLSVDFWASLRLQKLVTSDLTLDDAFIFADSAKLLKNRANKANDDQHQLADNIADLFLTQLNRFSVVNTHFTLRSDGIDKEFILGHLNWLNTGDRHQASGDVILEGLTSDKLKLLVDIKGAEFEELEGQIYVSGNNWNFTPWFDKNLVVEHEDTVSNINFNAWGNVESGQIRQVQIEIEDSTVEWLTNGEPQSFKMGGGDMVISKIAQGEFSIQSSPLKLSVNNQSWELLEVDSHISFGNDVAMYISQIDLAGFSKVVPLFIENTGENSLFGQLNLIGQVQEFYWRFYQQEHQVVMQFEDVAFDYSDGIPGLSNLSGNLVYSGDRFAGLVMAKDSALDFNEHFLQPMPFTQLSSKFDGRINRRSLELNTHDVEFKSQALHLTADAGFNFPKSGEASMSLLADIHRGDAEQAALFYPHLLMGQDLVDYLNDAIITGQLSQGQLLFNGPLSGFPFNHHQGIFAVNAELEGAKFKFDEEWPAITNFSANLNFTNDSMLITAREGRLSGLDVEGVTAQIEQLSGDQLLIVDADIEQQSPENITTLMQVSPLHDSVGETLTELVVSQPVSGEFNLVLPLQEVEKVVAKGHIKFDGNELQLNTPSMSFSKVKGDLFFENDVLKTQGVELEWLGMPLALDINAKAQPSYYQTQIDIKANWQESHWQSLVPSSLQTYASGDFSWQGLLSLNMHDNGGFSYDLDITSDLAATALSLPEPYRKNETERISLVANVEGQLNQSTLNVVLGEQLTFYGVLNHDEVQFTRSHLVLGDEQMLLPMDGFHITTKLEYADFSQWQPFINDILSALPDEQSAQVEPTSKPLIESPERIRGSIAHVEFLGQAFTNVSFNLLDQHNWWLLQVNAKEVRSEIKFYPDLQEQGIDVDADFIKLALKDGAETMLTTTSVEPAGAVQKLLFTEEETTDLFKDIPSMRVQCDSCQLGKIDFGELTFDIKHENDQLLTLNNFKANRDNNKIELDARWEYQPGVHSQTFINGKVSVKDIEQEVDRLGYASVIKDSGLKTEFDINWGSGPHEFTLAKLNGDVNIKIDDGYLADVSDKGARIFSILSLQSLVRKLTLDFRDIFSDGMFYSSINADVQIKDGTLYTDNVRMKGAAGDLSVKGNTELTHGVLDYRMSYKPNLTSSLPVLAWIATLNPYTFLAGVAIDEVFTSKVVSEFNFELTGTISEPNLREVNRKSRDISVGRSAPPQFVEQNKGAGNEPKTPIPNVPEDEQDKFDG